MKRSFIQPTNLHSLKRQRFSLCSNDHTAPLWLLLDALLSDAYRGSFGSLGPLLLGTVGTDHSGSVLEHTTLVGTLYYC
jgi:hypothetical protein